MKHNFRKKLTIDCTLDSSEAIMFTKGGRHSIIVKSLGDDENESLGIDFDFFDEIEVTVQLERNQQGRFDFVTGEATAHKKQWEEIHKTEQKV